MSNFAELAAALVNQSFTSDLAGILNSSSSLSILQNTTCEDLRRHDLEAQRQALLSAALESAATWSVQSSTIAGVSITLDLLMLATIIKLRRHRPLQRAGVRYLCCLLVGCLFGHIASLMDLLPPRGATCRGKLACIYLFLYFLLAPLLGKLFSLCRAAQNVLLAGHTAGWDRSAQRFTTAVLSLQITMIFFYLALTAGKPVREDRLQTICSDKVSEHAFHFLDGLLTVGLLVMAFGMVAWLQVRAPTPPRTSPPFLELSSFAPMAFGIRHARAAAGVVARARRRHE